MREVKMMIWTGTFSKMPLPEVLGAGVLSAPGNRVAVYGVLLLCGLMNLVALVLYGMDKLRAKRHQWRIPEMVLLGVGLLGGALGALLGMYFFRHKTRHWYFWALNWLGFVLLILLLWYFGRGFVS